MKSAIRIAILLAVLACGSNPQAAEPPPVTATNSITATNSMSFQEFLAEVVRANLDYAAQRYHVSLATAAIAAAKVFPNPTLDLSADRDLSFHGRTGIGTDGRPADLTQVESQSVGLSQTLELGGKRKYRILEARQSHAAAAATLDLFLQHLKLDAAAAFAEALALSRTAEQKRQTAAYLAELVKAQRERLRAGDISEVDVLQTQIEEQQFQNELLAAQAQADNARLALSGFLGRDRSQTQVLPKGSLELPARDFEVSDLLGNALRTRPDLLALRHAHEAARSGIKRAKALRVPDVDVGLAYTHNGGVALNHPIDPAPSYNQLTLSFSLPLPLWNRNRAGIASARLGAEQAQKQLEAAELKTELQIRQAFTTYRSTRARVNRYHGSILKDAEAVLEAKRFSYQRGEAKLIELLDAQRTANDLRAAYNETLAEHAKALIELQRAAGLSDIAF